MPTRLPAWLLDSVPNLAAFWDTDRVLLWQACLVEGPPIVSEQYDDRTSD